MDMLVGFRYAELKDVFSTFLKVQKILNPKWISTACRTTNVKSKGFVAVTFEDGKGDLVQAFLLEFQVSERHFQLYNPVPQLL